MQTIQPNILVPSMFIGTIDSSIFFTSFIDLDLGGSHNFSNSTLLSDQDEIWCGAEAI